MLEDSSESTEEEKTLRENFQKKKINLIFIISTPTLNYFVFVFVKIQFNIFFY